MILKFIYSMRARWKMCILKTNPIGICFSPPNFLLSAHHPSLIFFTIRFDPKTTAMCTLKASVFTLSTLCGIQTLTINWHTLSFHTFLFKRYSAATSYCHFWSFSYSLFLSLLNQLHSMLLCWDWLTKESQRGLGGGKVIWYISYFS